MADNAAEEAEARFEELTVLEAEFDNVDVELRATHPYPACLHRSN